MTLRDESTEVFSSPIQAVTIPTLAALVSISVCQGCASPAVRSTNDTPHRITFGPINSFRG